METTFRMSETVTTGLRKEIADLRESKRALESELQSSKKENEVLRNSSHRVADTTKAASQVNNERKGFFVCGFIFGCVCKQTESSQKTELREAQRELRRLKAELEETQGALKTAQTIANDATDRARQERARGSTINKVTNTHTASNNLR